jgi:uncharacterized repeat protein (TIGR01451 family)
MRRTVILALLILSSALGSRAQTLKTDTKPGVRAANSSLAPKALGIPLFFEANRGQADSQVKFLTRSSGYTMFVTPTETVLAEASTQIGGSKNGFGASLDINRAPAGALRMQLIGANRAPLMTGYEELPGKVNYLIGNDSTRWHTEVPLFSRVQTKQVYPGIDLVFHGDEKVLEYDFVVAPGADPDQVAFRIRGAKQIKIDTQGDLVLHTATSEFRMHRPVVYQQDGISRKAVDGGFVLSAKNEIRFRLGDYDRSQPLVIDPAIGYASFLGGAGLEQSFGIAVDDSTPASPKIFIDGTTTDSSTFPESSTTLGFGTASGANPVAEVGFVAMIDPTVSGPASLMYLTFVGGKTPATNNNNTPGCLSAFIWLALDKSQVGNIEPVLGGETTCSDFPHTVVLNPVSGNSQGFSAVATRLTADGSAVDKSAMLGGDDNVEGGFIAVNTAGDVILSGETSAQHLPVMNAYVSTFNNGNAAAFDDCFVSILNRSDLSISYLTYLNTGGNSTNVNSAGCGAFEDSSGNILAGGNTFSTTAFNLGPGGANLANGFQTTFQGTEDTFVMKLNPSLSGVNQLLFASYFGGGGTTLAGNGSFDLGNGVVAVVGRTNSAATGANTPAIPLANAFQSSNTASASANGYTGYLLVLDTTQTGLSSLLCSTYFGGSSGNDFVHGVTYDAADPTSFRIIIGGVTASSDFPTMNPFQSFTGAADGFVSVLKVPQPGQSFPASLYFSSFIGSGVAVTNPANGQVVETEAVEGVAVDANHTIYASAAAFSSNFFANTSPAPARIGFQPACTMCDATPTTPPFNDIALFSITTGGSATVQSVVVAPANTTIAAGSAQQFTATGTFSDGTIEDVTDTATWSSSNTSVATISNAAGSQGLATGVAGSATAVTITATSGNFAGQASLTVSGSAPSPSGAALAITKTAPATVPVNGTLTYTITVTNNGPADATGVVMSDPVPANLPPTMVVASEVCTRVIQLEVSTTLSCAIGALANGASTTITFDVSPTAAGILTNTATVTGTNNTNTTTNSATASTNVGGTVTPGAGAIRQLPGFTTNTLPANDDGSTGQVTLPFSVNFFGTTFSNLFVNNNGNVTFNNPLGEFTPTGLNSNNGGIPIIAPFWADVDTRGTGSNVVTYGNDTVNGRNAFGVDYINVGYFDENTDKLNSFQVILIDRSDTGTGNFDIEFNYNQVQWEVGDASGGSGGLCGTIQPPDCVPAAVGYSNGSGDAGTNFQLAGSFVPGGLLDSGPAATSLIHNDLNNTTPGRYLFSVRNGVVQGNTLTLTLAGTGTGTVKDNSTQQFTCSDTNGAQRTCTTTYPSGTQLILTATPDAGSTFTGWSAPCSGTGTCAFTITQDTPITATFTSSSVTLQSITVTPPTASIQAGATQAFTATGHFSDGSTAPVAVTWSSANTAVATINAASGVATGVAAGGPVTITATSTQTTTISGTAQLTVTAPVVLVSIAVTPANPTLVVGQTQQFTATGTFSDHSTQDLTSTVVWASSNTEAATISGGGLATGVTGGETTTISATKPQGNTNIVGTTTLNVTTVPFVLGITPPPGTSPGTPPSVSPGGSLALGLVLTAAPGFSGTVTFSCVSNAPQFLTCTPAPNSVVLSGNTPRQVAIVMNTFCQGDTPMYGPGPGGFGGGLALLLAAIMLGSITWAYRTRSRWALSFAVLMLIALGSAACSSVPNGPSGRTPAGDYVLSITATAGGASQTVQVPIHVTQ